ncbi:MAG: ribonuclease R [Thermoanaerobaculia bacterium]|nr:ribonuclease R [Thermoanaerobaculia bacterium]
MSNSESGRSKRLRLELRSELERAGRKGRPARYLLSRWSDEYEPDEIEGALDGLAREGVAVFWDTRWIALDARDDWEVGTFRSQRSGAGTVRSRDESFYVPRNQERGARDGDKVLVRPSNQRKRRGRHSGLRTAPVLRVLTSATAEVVGFLERERGEWLLIPFDTQSRLRITVTGDRRGAKEGEYVVVELEGSGQGDEATGKVVEVLGSVYDPGVDVDVVVRHFQIPDEMPEAVLEEARTFPEDPPEEELEGREDLRDLVTVTIDGKTARDFDDAISVERLENGNFRLGVHIADVSHYVEPGSALDEEALRRGNSVYYPERAIPMLPERLSTGLCSLRPEVPRLAVSVFLEIDVLGRVQSRRFCRSVIRSHRRMTYDEVRRILEQGRPEDEEEYGEILPMLLEARALMTCLYRARTARGSLDFDLPEGDVILDTDGVVVGIRPGERHSAHRIIEEFMIAANRAVARELEEKGQPGIYRVHHPPDPERIGELEEILAPMGVRMDHDRDDPSPRALQDVIRQMEAHPQEDFVSQVVLRAQQRAIYYPECQGHYALAANHYLHFTSPIRRYPDLVVHRSLTRLLTGRKQGGGEKGLDLEPLSDHLSQTERRAEASERELLQWKKVRFLSSRVGERFTGRITGVMPFGLFVQLDELFVDGLVPIATLGDEYFEFEEKAHRLVGTQTGTVYRLADPVEVELEDVDDRHRGLNLRMVHRLVEKGRKPEPEPGKRRGRRRGRKRGG